MPAARTLKTLLRRRMRPSAGCAGRTPSSPVCTRLRLMVTDNRFTAAPPVHAGTIGQLSVDQGAICLFVNNYLEYDRTSC